jgi:23S rRNA pseudouridine2457 synthase
MSNEFRYFMVYKPFEMLSQFTSQHAKHNTLADLDFEFPKDAYPVGRLDNDSEGLLLITNDKTLNHRVLQPVHAHTRSYFAQVEGAATDEDLADLREGVTIKANKKTYDTIPALLEIAGEEPPFPERFPPIRKRKNVPTTWIKLTLTEGKNRQVRRMTAYAGFPTLRLVRVSMQGLEIGNMQPGEVKEFSEAEMYEKLFGESV